MTIFELITSFVDEDVQEFEVYDTSEGEVIFNGYLDDLPSNLADEEVSSIDNLSTISDTLTINIMS